MQPKHRSIKLKASPFILKNRTSRQEVGGIRRGCRLQACWRQAPGAGLTAAHSLTDPTLLQQGWHFGTDRSHYGDSPKLLPGLSVAIAMAIGLHSGMASAAEELVVPTGLLQPSPLFGAQPFSARIVLFEEFGLRDFNNEAVTSGVNLPPPVNSITGLTDCQGNHDVKGLDNLIASTTLYPLPEEMAHHEKDAQGKFLYSNPWEKQIKECLGDNDAHVQSNTSLPMDGRPGETDFAHQRWNEQNPATGDFEFQPKKFFTSVMAGARNNSGVRNPFQLHGYKQPVIVGKWSEFGKGGLYFNTVTSPFSVGGPLNSMLTAAEKTKETSVYPYVKSFEGTTKGIPIQVHPRMPIQDRNAVWYPAAEIINGSLRRNGFIQAP